MPTGKRKVKELWSEGYKAGPKKRIQDMDKKTYEQTQAASCKKRKAAGKPCVYIPFSKRNDKGYAKQAEKKAYDVFNKKKYNK